MIARVVKSVSIVALVLSATLAGAQKAPNPPAAAAPDPSKGTIVFFREKKFAGAAVRYKVREGEVELGRLGSGTYFTVQATPGTHQYTVHSEAKDVLTLEVDPGEIYYVIGSITMGALAGHPNLSPSDVATFEAMKPKMKDVTGEAIAAD